MLIFGLAIGLAIGFVIGILIRNSEISYYQENISEYKSELNKRNEEIELLSSKLNDIKEITATHVNDCPKRHATIQFEKQVCKGGQNPPNISTIRPPIPEDITSYVNKLNY